MTTITLTDREANFLEQYLTQRFGCDIEPQRTGEACHS